MKHNRSGNKYIELRLFILNIYQEMWDVFAFERVNRINVFMCWLAVGRWFVKLFGTIKLCAIKAEAAHCDADKVLATQE